MWNLAGFSKKSVLPGSKAGFSLTLPAHEPKSAARF
jgi:hypothetical protein